MKGLLTLVLLGSACASAQDEVAVVHATAACGPDSAQFEIKIDRSRHPLGTVEPGKALVYVIEDQKTKFIKDVTTRVALNSSWVGANRGDSYFFFTVEPGENHLCADWESPFLAADRLISLAHFTAEAGKVYYFRARTTGSSGSGAGNHQDQLPSLDLELVNDDQGALLVASSPFSSSRHR